MPIPIPNVKGATLEKVIEWCRQHKGDTVEGEEHDKTFTQWDLSSW